MSLETLTGLLRQIQGTAERRSFVDALRLVREAKIADLHNIYLSALEQHLTAIQYAPPTPDGQTSAAEDKQLIPLLVERAIMDCKHRHERLQDHREAPDELTLGRERTKHLYFQRTDELLERREYKRALEEIKRVYCFDPANVVAREYEKKIEQLISITAQQP